MTPPKAETAELWALPRLGEQRKAAIRDCWGAFLVSRVIVWASGMAAVLIFGWAAERSARWDPLYTTLPFDDNFLNLLAAPAARWDSAWYLAIAEHGYAITDRAAFFPLFPALTAGLGAVMGSPLVAGVVLSSVCALVALYLLHRLVALDFGVVPAGTAVRFMAWFPSALVLSAVYTESLFLLLSIGSLYSGRLGRWPLAALLAGLAAATRSTGFLLIVPLLVLYLWGPRADREADDGTGRRPRYRIGPDVLWVLAIPPAGLLAYMAYLAVTAGDPLGAFHAQADWERALIPLGGIAMGAAAAFEGLLELTPGVASPSPLAHQQLAELIAVRDVVLFAFLLVALWLVYECWQRLPAAYTAHAVCGLALPLSMPAASNPLMSLPRFMFVLFPLSIALALWAGERSRERHVIVVLASLLALFSGLFATWAWAP